MRRLGFAAVAALASVAAVWASDRPDPATATLDGCGTVRNEIFAQQEPNWAYVGDHTVAATDPPPPPQWAAGVVRAGGSSPLGVHPTGVDDPLTHDAYDGIVNFLPSAASGFLLGGDAASKTGNFNGEEEENGRLHMEREEVGFPFAVWPENGDRVEAFGSWVWDCEHFQQGGSKTELHPLRALWVERGVSPRSPTGETEADLWYSNDKTPAGVEADCAHETKGDHGLFKACLRREPRFWEETLTRTFFLAAPPRHAPGARLHVRVVDVGSSIGAPRPRVELVPTGARVTLAVHATSTQGVRLAYELFAGWSGAPRVRHLRVRLEELIVRRAMDPSCPVSDPQCPYRNETTQLGQIATAPGEWLLYVDVAGIWDRVRPLVLRVRDGQRVPLRNSFDLYLARGRPWRLFTFGRECDFGFATFDDPAKSVYPCPRTKEFGNPVGDDKPGYIAVRGSLGRHATDASLDTSTCPPSNQHGCYRLIWSARVVGRQG